MKNYPKVSFVYSWIYDKKWMDFWVLKGKKKKDYPSHEEILNYIEKAENVWRKDEKKIIQEISKITNLDWKTNNISCYAVGRCSPFSHPLTIPIYEKDFNHFIDELIHELIHNIFYPNYEKMEKYWNYICKKHKNETWTTQIHILLYAIHWHIYLKFYDKKRLENDIERMKVLPDYKKAWEIVQKEGYESIIEDFIKRVLK